MIYILHRRLLECIYLNKYLIPAKAKNESRLSNLPDLIDCLSQKTFVLLQDLFSYF